MSPKAKTVLTVSISIVLAISLIWWAMRGLDLNRTIESLQKADYRWVGLSVLLGSTAYYIRSERWKLLLNAMGYTPKSSHSFYSVCMNYFWNLLIPRSGEIARCTTLYTLTKTPVDKSFGTVISERVIDLLCLMTIALLAVIFNVDLIQKLFDEVLLARSGGEESSGFGIYILLGLLALTIPLLFLFKNKIKSFAFYPKVKNFIYGIRHGLISIFKLKRSGLFIFYTFIIWLFYFLMTYVVVFALPETSHLTIADGLYLLLVGGIGMVIPASGGIGAFHSAMRLGFVVLGLGSEVGVTFGFLVHTPHTMIALIMGLISFVMISVEKSKKPKAI